jgi:hypothetical protein
VRSSPSDVDACSLPSDVSHAVVRFHSALRLGRTACPSVEMAWPRFLGGMSVFAAVEALRAFCELTSPSSRQSSRPVGSAGTDASPPGSVAKFLDMRV